jgi:long-chain acyl-CoA synthetase
LTPKLSIKRNVILEDFADTIDGLYEDAPATQGHSIVG